MYCINCGVKLADTEQTCPFCRTAPDIPLVKREPVRTLYPENRYPNGTVKTGAVNGTVLFLFMLPLLVTFFVDLHYDRKLNWFWFVAGAIVLAYVIIALPLWFRKPNPIIFVPCDFGAIALYLLLIQILTVSNWYFPFALPVTGSIGLIVTAMVVLLRCLRKGKLYILGGGTLALGAVVLLIELLLTATFSLPFVGWSVYPLTALTVLGGLLIFLAISGSAREKMERKFFI